MFRTMENGFNSRTQPGYNADKSYALSGKIMLCAIVILFAVVILMVCLHLYARWHLLRARRRHNRRNRNRRTHFVFFGNSTNPNPINANSRRLDASVLKSLPVFVFSSKTHTDVMDCAVCLSEFEENESGRVLPKCSHSFHVDCIDMWFQTHDTCPLCRSPVELVTQESEIPTQVAISMSEPGSSSEMCDTCRHEEATRNNNEDFGHESTGIDSAASQSQSQSSSRSPIGRMLSFKRMLSREKKSNSTPSGTVSSCSGNEVDIEQGREENRQTEC